MAPVECGQHDGERMTTGQKCGERAQEVFGVFAGHVGGCVEHQVPLRFIHFRSKLSPLPIIR